MTVSGKDKRGLVEKLRTLRTRLDRLERRNAELVQVEQELRESLEQFKTIFDNTLVGLYRTTPDGRILMANSVVVNMLGYSSFDELARRNIENDGYEPQYSRSVFKERIEREGKVIGLESAWKRSDGTMLYVRENAQAVRDESGKTLYYQGTVEDITEHRQTKRALHESEELFVALAANLSEGVDIVDENLCCLFANPASEKILGAEPGGLVGRTLHEFVSDEGHALLEKERSKRREGIASSYDLEIIRPDGQKRQLIVTASPRLSEDGKYVGALAVFFDVTGKKQAEDALRKAHDELEMRVQERTAELEQANKALQAQVAERIKAERTRIASEMRYRTTLDAMGDAIHVVDSDLRIVLANKRFWQWTEEVGVEVADAIGRTIFDLFPFLPDKVRDEYRHVFDSGRGLNTEETNKVANREIVTETRKIPVKEAGRVVKVVTAIRDVTERKKAEEALKETTGLLETIFAHTHILVAYLDPQFKIVRVNRAYAQADGREPSFFVGRNHFDLYPNAENEAIFRKVVAIGVPYFAHARPFKYPEHPERGVTHWDWSLMPIKQQDGVVCGLVLTLVNVTEQKRAEQALRESEERYRSFVQNFKGIAYRSKMDSTPIFFHGAVEEITGYTQDEFIAGKPRWNEIVHPDDLRTVFTKDEERLHTVPNYACEREYRIVRKDGRTRWVHEVIQNTCDKTSGPVTLQGAIYDVTGRKHAEEEIRKSEKRCRFLVDFASDSIFLLDLKGGFMDVNPAACDSLGRTREELLGLSMSDIDPDWPSKELEGFLRELAAGKPVTIEGTHRRKNKTSFPVEIRLTKVDADEGQVVLALVRDITQRRRTEESLRRRVEAVSYEDKVHVSGMDIEWDHRRGLCTFEKLPVAMMWIDTTLAGLMSGVQAMVGTERFGLALQAEGRKSVEDDWRVISQFSDFNRGFEAIANIAAVAGWGDWKLIEIDAENKGCLFRVWNSWEGLYQKALGVSWGSGMLAGKLAGYCSMLFKTNCWADQTAFVAKGDAFDEFKVHASKRLLEEEIENLLATDKATRADMAVALQKLRSEIAKRTCVEQALRESEQRMELVLRGADLGTWDWNVQTGEVTFNERWAEMLGCTLDQIDPHVSAWERQIHPDDLPVVKETLNAHLEGEMDFYESEHRLRHKSGGWIWVLDKGKVTERDADGRPLRACGTHLDITARKRAEQALREREATLTSIFGAAPVGIGLECNRVLSRVNDTICEMLGYSRDEIIGQHAEMFYPSEEDYERVKGETRRQILEKGKGTVETRWKRKDGRIIDVLLSTTVLDPADFLKGVTFTALDITERKAAEEAIRESEEKFRTLAEQSPNMIFINKKGRIVYANKKCEDTMGYTREEFYSPDFDFRVLISPESVDAINERLAKHLRGRDVEPYDYCLINKAGKKIEAINSSKLIPYEGETAILGIVTDITERKKAEQALRESQERLKILFESAPDAIYVTDLEGRFVDCNRTAEELVGFTKAELIGRNLAESLLLSAEDLSKAAANVRAVASGRPSGPTEYTVRRKSGSLIAVEVRTFPVRISDQVVSLGIARDVTDRKRAQQRLLEDREQLKSLASQLSLTEERERHRLATELHDQIGQSLVISKIKLDQLRRNESSGELSSALDEVSACLGRVINDTRTLTFDLSYPILYELGFEAAVAEWLTEHIQEKHGIETVFEDDGQSKPLDDDIRALLFRNVRELLINVVKHARARCVKVTTRRVKDHIRISVEDDGVGFDPVEVTAMAAKRAEFGLLSIRERLEQLGGLFEVVSAPGRGTRVTMTAPLKYKKKEG